MRRDDLNLVSLRKRRLQNLENDIYQSNKYKNISKFKKQELMQNVNSLKTVNKPIDYNNLSREMENIRLELKECTRRKERKSILFAKKLRGKGSGAKRHKMRPESKIDC